ncbi:hypothetical protein VW23_026265 [Devosia insulae DS-56]|uniref:Lysozyme inhibitor LprI N-terminal domain-containing protein n=1 Tax=Devosia insulae DS-56 TaxID=1116389 RepID=A0A1E5XKZ0_9HYPH|nr:hypothetical protein [Devosia insulae]OEO29276.1 hypothetical protein VW23_026265 [Devosia insulae DS-56]
MKLRILAVVLALMPLPQLAVAQEVQQGALLQQVYVLWGMMDGAANFCWEAANYDVAYMEAHQNWLANNVIVRDELDATLAASGEAPALAGESEAAGSTGIVDILKQATNPEEACGNWLRATLAGDYDAELYMAEQLGLLRERDGM